MSHNLWLKQITLENVSYKIRKHTVMDSHSFDLKKGDFIWLRSGTGSGKSTMMKLVCGLLPPTEGKILINGRDLQKFSDDEIKNYRLRLGYLFEMGGLLQTLSVEENLLLPLVYHKICSQEEAKERVRYWLTQFKMLHTAKQKPFVLSGSQRKAACALRAIIHEPELLLFDEPMAGLNDEHMSILFNWIEEQKRQDKLFSLIVASDRSINHYFKSNQEWAA